MGNVLPMERFVIGLGNVPDMNFLFILGQHMFFAILELLRYVTIAKRMITLVESATGIIWPDSWGLLMFLAKFEL